MKVYLAGPMSGYPQFNIPSFDIAAVALRAAGHEVVSPAEVDGPELRAVYLESPDGSHEGLEQREQPYSYYLDRDLDIIRHGDFDAIVTLPGWERSPGANREVGFALGLGVPRFDYDQTRMSCIRVPGEDYAAAAAIHLDGTEGGDVLPGDSEPAFSHSDPLYGADGKFITHESNPLRQRSLDGGVKDNRGKPPLDLIPYEPLLGAAEVLAFGARKYKPGNWRLGLSWSQTWSSLQRHLWAWMNGEEIDPESGHPHIDHATCQMLFLSTYVHTGMTRFDDRWVSTPHEEAEA